VATSEEELGRLQTLYERGIANGIQGLELVGPERSREIEPNAKAIRALYSPVTAIVDYRQVVQEDPGHPSSQFHKTRVSRISTQSLSIKSVEWQEILSCQLRKLQPAPILYLGAGKK
jgi:L-2-hydroxyglutarate oxidase LhgO